MSDGRLEKRGERSWNEEERDGNRYTCINIKLLTNYITGDDWQDVNAYYHISCLWIKCV